MTEHRFAFAIAVGPAPLTTRTVGVLAGTLTLAAACWGIAAWQMRGMDMGTASELGSFGLFAGLWVSMMAAMMLPGAAAAVVRRAGAGGVRAAPVFAGSYLAVWALAGLAVYATYRPHGSAIAGVLVIAAGIYELTPVKRHFRRRCLETVRSGVAFGVCCVGSSLGLMVIWLALGVMSLAWMSVVAVVTLAQKLLPVNLAIDVPVALAIIGLGIWVIVTRTPPL